MQLLYLGCMLYNRNSMGCLRVLACCAVVVLHVAAPYIYVFGEISPFGWHFANLLDSATRWCVPVFVMISGALNINPKNKDAVAYLRRRMGRLLPVIVFWAAFYSLYSYFYYGSPAGWEALWGNLLSGTPYFHLYFLFLIAGLYIFTPFIAEAVYDMPTPSVALLVGICLSFSVLAAFFGLKLNVFSWFIPYIGYYILGYLLVRLSIPRTFALSLFIGTIIFTTVATWIMVKTLGPDGHWGLYFYSYLSPNVVFMSIAIFTLVMPLEFYDRYDLISRLSALTLGVYILHPIVLDQCVAILAGFDLETGNALIDISTRIFWTLATTFLLVALGVRIPWAKKILA